LALSQIGPESDAILEKRAFLSDIRSGPLDRIQTVRGRVVERGRLHPRKQAKNCPCNRQGQTASPKAMLWSVERPFVGALALRIPGAAPRHRNGPVPAVLPASTEHGERTIGVPQEPGRSCRLLGELPAGATGLTTPGLGGALVRRGAKRTSGRGGTAKRRQRSAAGWAAGSRSASIVPSKRGNSPRRTPWREASRQSAGPTEGNMLNTSRFIRMSTGLGRIATGTLRGWRNCRLRNWML
jgi:hypothetical protein